MNNVLKRKKLKFAQIFRKYCFYLQQKHLGCQDGIKKRPFINNVNAKFRMISRNDQQTPKISNISFLLSTFKIVAKF